MPFCRNLRGKRSCYLGKYETSMQVTKPSTMSPLSHNLSIPPLLFFKRIILVNRWHNDIKGVYFTMDNRLAPYCVLFFAPISPTVLSSLVCMSASCLLVCSPRCLDGRDSNCKIFFARSFTKIILTSLAIDFAPFPEKLPKMSQHL